VRLANAAKDLAVRGLKAGPVLQRVVGMDALAASPTDKSH
jgi:hypothetical protein